MFSAKAKVCGVIGNPVGHSMSPTLHRYISEQMGEDLAYVPLGVKEDLESAVKGAFALGFTGMNVTIPYKQEVMHYLEEIDDTAKGIGAVNTLVRMDKGFKGYNTDLGGLSLSLKDNAIEIRDKKVIILGAGGAAKAVLYMVCQDGASEVHIFNRNVDKANALVEEMAKKTDFSMPIYVDDIAILSQKDRIQHLLRDRYIVFQTSSVGMYPNVSDCLNLDEAFYDRVDAGVDIIYTPLETVFLSKLRQRGVKTLNGLEMLINQGILAWELWTGRKVSEEIKKGAKEEIISFLGLK